MPEYRPRRWLVHLSLAFGAGVLLGLRAQNTPLWMIGAALAAALTLLLRRSGRSVYPGCILLAALLGLSRCAAAAHPALPPEGAYTVRGIVRGEASLRERDGRAALYLHEVSLDGAGRYDVYWTYYPKEGEAPPEDGREVCFEGNVYHPASAANPHGFDFRLYLLQKGVLLGVSGCGGLTISPDRAASPGIVPRLRGRIRAVLQSLLGAQSPLAEALILGDQSALPEELAEGFRRAGVAHVLAVSGLHMMIVFAFLLRGLRRLSSSPRTVLIICLPLIAGYGLLTGMHASALRAGLLVFYLQGGRVARRRADPLTGLAAAFLLILLLRPLDLFTAGFQMSFGAVLGLVLLGDALRARMPRCRKPWIGSIVNAYISTLCASVGAAMPIVWHLHELPLVGLLISPLAVAAVTLLLPPLFVTLALGLIWLPLGLAPARLASLLGVLIVRGVRFAARLPFAGFAVPRPPVYCMAALAFSLVLCTRYTLLRRRIRLILCACVLGGCAAVLLLTRNADVRYLQFSMGNADAAVIEDGDYTFVIDAGVYGGDVAEYLLSEGRRADALILTHLHSDHALGLGDLMRRRVEIGAVYLSAEAERGPVSSACVDALNQAREAGIPVRTLRAGDTLCSGRVCVETVWPQAVCLDAGAEGNDLALAFRIDLDGLRMLYMSDVETPYELRAASPADVLRVGHHGSNGGTCERFLDMVGPSAALISARRPGEATLQRLADRGIPVYDTGSRGALTLTVRRGRARIRGFLQ